MKIFGYNKEIKSFAIHIDYGLAYNRVSITQEENIYGLWDDATIDLTETPRTIEKYLAPSVPKSGKLYFHKSAKFPRNILTNTNFERKIALENADYMVVGKQTPVKSGVYVIFETDSAIYITDGRYYDSDLEEVVKILGDNAKLIYTGYVSVYRPGSQDLLLQQYFPKPLILDEDLLKEVNSQIASPLDVNSVEQIIQLLRSSDRTNVGLGLKLLATSDFHKHPFTATTILLQNTAWNYTKEKHQVHVEAMLKTLKISNIRRNYYRILRNPNIYTEITGFTFTDEDLLLVNNFLREAAKLELLRYNKKQFENYIILES